jgi:hypothetical protein
MVLCPPVYGGKAKLIDPALADRLSAPARRLESTHRQSPMKCLTVMGSADILCLPVHGSTSLIPGVKT